jgi:hypothetical protein
LREAFTSLETEYSNVMRGPTGTDPRRGEKAYDVLKKVWLITGLVALWGIGAGLLQMFGHIWEYLWLFNPEVHVSPLRIIEISLAWWLITWLLAFIWYERRILWLHNQQTLALHRWQQSVHAAQHVGEEAVRLAAAYEQMRDWSEIIGWMLHRPEGIVAESTAIEERSAAGPFPLALQLAVGRSSETQVAQLTAGVSRTVYSKAWLGNLFALYHQAASKGFNKRLGLRDDTGPDLDREISSPEPRRALLQALEQGTYAFRWHNSVRKAVQKYLTDLGPEEIFDELAWPESVTPPPALRDVGPSEFLAGIEATDGTGIESFAGSTFSDAARLKRLDQVHKSVIWSSARSTRKTDADDPSVTRNFSSSENSEFLASLRLDLSDNCAISDTTLFTRLPEDKREPDRRRGSDDIG